MTAKGEPVSFRDDKNILTLTVAMVAHICEDAKSHWTVHLKWVHRGVQRSTSIKLCFKEQKRWDELTRSLLHLGRHGSPRKQGASGRGRPMKTSAHSAEGKQSGAQSDARSHRPPSGGLPWVPAVLPGGGLPGPRDRCISGAFIPALRTRRCLCRRAPWHCSPVHTRLSRRPSLSHAWGRLVTKPSPCLVRTGRWAPDLCPYSHASSARPPSCCQSPRGRGAQRPRQPSPGKARWTEMPHVTNRGVSRSGKKALRKKLVP